MGALRRRSVRIAIAAVVTALATTAWMPAVVAAPGRPGAREASDASSTARDYWSMTERGTNPFASRTIRCWARRRGALLAPDRDRQRAATAVRLEREVGDRDSRRDQPLHAARARPDGRGDIRAPGPPRRPPSGRGVRGLCVHLQHLPPAQDRLRARQPRACVDLPGARPRVARAAPQAHAGLRRRGGRRPGGGVLRALVLRRDRIGARGGAGRVRADSESRGQTIVRLATAAGVTALLVLPAVAGLVLNRGDIAVSAGHRAEATEAFGARPLAYLVPAAGNPITGGVVGYDRRANLGPDGGEPDLYFGWVTILLAGAGVVLLVRRRAPLRRTGSAVPPRSLPRYSSLSGSCGRCPTTSTCSGVELPTPSLLAGLFTNYLRVYGRFGILVGLGLAMLAAFALDALSAAGAGRCSVRRRARPASRRPRLRRAHPGLEREPDTCARHLPRKPAARHRRLLPTPGGERSREPQRQRGAVLADPARPAPVLHRELPQGPRLGDPGARRPARRAERPPVARRRGRALRGRQRRGLPGRRGSPPERRSRCSRASATSASSRSSPSPAISRLPCTTRQHAIAAAMGIPVPTTRIPATASTSRSASYDGRTGAG